MGCTKVTIDYWDIRILVTTSLSNLIRWEFCRNYKRTQQGISNIFGNSHLLNISASVFNTFYFLFSFLICTLLISSFLICFLNSSIKSIVFSKFSNPSHISSFAVYSFYLTKYFGFLSYFFYSIISQPHILFPCLFLLEKVRSFSVSLPTFNILLFYSY